MPEDQMLYFLFGSLHSLASDMHLPNRPLYSDINWILSLMQNGKIRKPNGEAFAPDVTYQQATTEILDIIKTDATASREGKPGRRLLFPNVERSQQILLIEKDGQFEPVGFEFVGRGRNMGVRAFTASEKNPNYNKYGQPDKDSRYFDEVRTAVSGLLSELHATDSVFSSDTELYDDYKTALENLNAALNSDNVDFANPPSADEINWRLKSVVDIASKYADAKLDQDSLSSRQIDRLSVYMGLRDLQKRVDNIASNRKKLSDAEAKINDYNTYVNVPGNENFKEILNQAAEVYGEKKAEAERELAKADNSLSPCELSRQKIAGKIVIANLKNQGPEAVKRVLKSQRDADRKNAEIGKPEENGEIINKAQQLGMYDGLVSGIKATREYQDMIGITYDDFGRVNQYPEETTEKNYKLAVKSPDKVLEKFKEKVKTSASIREKYNTSPYKWKNSPAEKQSRSEAVQRVRSIGNPSLAAICEYTLKLTDQMSRELLEAESSRHSDSYKVFRAQLNDTHNKIIGEINDILDANEKNLLTDTRKISEKIFGALKNVVGEVNKAASEYQAYHAGISFGNSSQKMVKRLELATGVRVINDFLTNPANTEGILSGQDYSLDDMKLEIAAYRCRCQSMNRKIDYHAASLDNLDHYLHNAEKSPKLNAADRNIGQFADYDSKDGFKARKDALRNRMAAGEKEYELYKSFLEKDKWGKLAKSAQKQPEKSVKAGIIENKKIDNPVLNNGDSIPSFGRK